MDSQLDAMLSFHKWNMSTSHIVDEYNLSEEQVTEALRFYELNKEQINSCISKIIRTYTELTTKINKKLSCEKYTSTLN